MVGRARHGHRTVLHHHVHYLVVLLAEKRRVDPRQDTYEYLRRGTVLRLQIQLRHCAHRLIYGCCRLHCDHCVLCLQVGHRGAARARKVAESERIDRGLHHVVPGETEGLRGVRQQPGVDQSGPGEVDLLLLRLLRGHHGVLRADGQGHDDHDDLPVLHHTRLPHHHLRRHVLLLLLAQHAHRHTHLRLRHLGHCATIHPHRSLRWPQLLHGHALHGSLRTLYPHLYVCPQQK